MVFKTILSFICGLYKFYPWVKLTVLPSFTQFYPTSFTHWVKLPCQPWLKRRRGEVWGGNILLPNGGWACGGAVTPPQKSFVFFPSKWCFLMHSDQL